MFTRLYRSIAAVTQDDAMEIDDDDELVSPQSSHLVGLAEPDANLVLSPITSIESYNQALPEEKYIPGEPAADSDHTPPPPTPCILDLPHEVLIRILELVYFDTDTFSSINKILENYSKINLINRYFHLIGNKFFYKYGIFNRPHSFDKFLANLSANPHVGRYVQFIDFEHFTSIGLGRTGKMNQEIQMVTSRTIYKCLNMTPHLVEFLASESIQDDISVDVLHFLFNDLSHLQAMDFCGASSEAFFHAFNDLVIEKPLKKLFKLSLHDCSNLSLDIFQKVLPNLINLRRLDLTHTAITSTMLLNHLPHTCNLTHLSLSRCSKLTTRDLINFLLNHPAVSNHQLRWLNLAIDSNVVSPFTENYLLFTMKHIKADFLESLNLGGLPVNAKIVNLIILRFHHLKTLSIHHSSVKFDDINPLLNNTSVWNIDLTGCKLSKSDILQLVKFNNLISIEFDSKVLKSLTNNDGEFLRSGKDFWRFFDNNGRRSWIYKLERDSDEYQQISQYGRLLNLNLTYYDLNTGEKIVKKQSKPEFLKYVGRKINCSIGFEYLNYVKDKDYLNNWDNKESVWPEEFCERGIYNYYSLNI